MREMKGKSRVWSEVKDVCYPEFGKCEWIRTRRKIFEEGVKRYIFQWLRDEDGCRWNIWNK